MECLGGTGVPGASVLAVAGSMAVTVPEVRIVPAVRCHSDARYHGNHYSPKFTKEETRAQRG